MAKADPKNSDSIATIQEEADALARHIENSDADAPKKPQPPPTPTKNIWASWSIPFAQLPKPKIPNWPIQNYRHRQKL